MPEFQHAAGRIGATGGAGRDRYQVKAEYGTPVCRGFPSLEHDYKDRIFDRHHLEAAICRLQERNDEMTFLAIPVDPAVSQSIHAGLEPLRAMCPETLWEHPADYHLTLRFLGRCSDAQIADLVRKLETRAPQGSSHDLQVGGLGSFPPRHGRAVLWVSVMTVPPPLLALVQLLEAWAVDLGFSPEVKRFVPHITVARCSVPDYGLLKTKLSLFACPSPSSWRVTHYALMSRRHDRSSGPSQPVYAGYCAVPLLRNDASEG